MSKIFNIKVVTMLLPLFFFTHTYSQTLFYESFDETDNSTNGVDSVGVSWSVTAPYSGNSDDYFKVVNNLLEARDSNGPSVFETNDFSTSTCSDDIKISMDISHVGDMEGNDPSEYGCNTVDIIKLEWSWDNGSTWSSIGYPNSGLMTNDIVAQGCSCGNPPSTNYPVPWDCSDVVVGPFIAIGDFDPHTPEICISLEGTSMRIRITTMQWAGTEYHRIDNIRVECSNCITALPIELMSFEGEHNYKSGLNELKWITASESDNDRFEIYSSNDGEFWEIIGTVNGAGNTTIQQSYRFNHKPKQNLTYYRLKQIDFNGNFEYSNIISISKKEDKILDIKYYDLLGKELPSEPTNGLFIKITQYEYRTEHMRIFK